MPKLVIKKNYKQVILDELETIKQGCIATQDRWKVRAYNKAIESLNETDKIYSHQDVEKLEFIGKSIIEKVKDIIANGFSIHAKRIKEDPNISFINEVIKINGIGPSKAKKLLEENVNSLDKLISRPDLLTSKQQLGLRHYQQFSKKIPRNEMDKHSSFLRIMSDNRIIITGSYRRKKSESGDIDVLFHSEEDSLEEFKNFIEILKSNGYITNDISYGTIKYMGYCKIDQFERRIDIMFCPKKEFPFAILYFTGSATFNTHMRSVFAQKKLRLNEHGIFRRDGTEVNLNIKTEKDIFNFLKIRYIEPEYRSKETLQAALNKPKKLKIKN